MTIPVADWWSFIFQVVRNLLIIWICCTKRGDVPIRLRHSSTMPETCCSSGHVVQKGGGVFHNVRSLLNVGQCDFLLVQKSGRFCKEGSRRYWHSILSTGVGSSIIDISINNKVLEDRWTTSTSTSILLLSNIRKQTSH